MYVSVIPYPYKVVALSALLVSTASTLVSRLAKLLLVVFKAIFVAEISYKLFILDTNPAI